MKLTKAQKERKPKELLPFVQELRKKRREMDAGLKEVLSAAISAYRL